MLDIQNLQKAYANRTINQNGSSSFTYEGKEVNFSSVEDKYAHTLINGKNPLLIGDPSTGKSAILETIGHKLNFYVVPIPVTIVDELAMGMFPDPNHTGQFVKVKLPDWCEFTVAPYLESNKYNGCLVIFDEFNRGRQELMNATMGILNERRIQTFKFPNFVLFAATGNKGSEDKTKVKQMDDAIKGRFKIIKHELPLHQWMESFAENNLLSEIVKFLKKNPEKAYPNTILAQKEYDNITNYRSWTNFSNTLENAIKFKDGDRLENLKKEVNFILAQDISDISISITKDFADYLMELKKLNIADFLAGLYWDKKLDLESNEKMNFLTEIIGYIQSTAKEEYKKSRKEKEPFTYYSKEIFGQNHPLKLLNNFMKNNCDLNKEGELIYALFNTSQNFGLTENEVFAKINLPNKGEEYSLFDKYLYDILKIVEKMEFRSVASMTNILNKLRSGDISGIERMCQKACKTQLRYQMIKEAYSEAWTEFAKAYNIDNKTYNDLLKVINEKLHI